MVQVRNAERTDVKLLKQMIDEMGRHERLQVFATEETLAPDGFGPRPKFRALLAEWDAAPAGYVLFYDCYSSFQGKGVFLEDLYVRNDFRGKSVGNALLSRVANIAIQERCFGILFNVLEWNEPALKFFKSAGATLLHERKTLCLNGTPLQEIAKKANGSHGRRVSNQLVG